MRGDFFMERDMRIYSLYRDFFEFLANIIPESEKWQAYFRFYYLPHKDFLDFYFSRFPLLDFHSLKSRVEDIKAADYSLLKGLIAYCPPEPIIHKAYKRVKELIPPPQEPEVYLLIGFFSPDGFVMDFSGNPVICFGLERFKHFRLLRILFAHEYAHFLLRSRGKSVFGKNDFEREMISEGLATYLSFLAFPEYGLADHFFYSRDTLNWCQANESYLRRLYASGHYKDFPPRTGKYLGFLTVKKHIKNKGGNSLLDLFSNPGLVFSLDSKK
jgi:hypothetical protein